VRCCKPNARSGAKLLPAEASQDFMRAAHTLASTCEPLVSPRSPIDVAGALEQWTEFAKETANAADAETVKSAVADLAKWWKP
jgi:hypothetical protein